MQKTKIEWCDMTVNPIIGCKTGCAYCFAKRMNDTRFHWVEDFSDPKETKTWRKALRKREPQNIFIGDLCDLFGDWVSDDMIREVLEACENSPQHRYLFLTKNPARYRSVLSTSFMLGNLRLAEKWYGTTVTGDRDFGRAFNLPWGHTGFLSIEPLIEPISEKNLWSFDDMWANWVIIGAESGDRADKVTPKQEWVETICDACDRRRIPVFMKNSLIPIVGEENMRQEFPWEV